MKTISFDNVFDIGDRIFVIYNFRKGLVKMDYVVGITVSIGRLGTAIYYLLRDTPNDSVLSEDVFDNPNDAFKAILESVKEE